MKYYSTRDTSRSKAYTLKEAAFMGLAPDGGLFIPERIPQVDMDIVRQKAKQSYADMAIYLAGLFFGEDVPGDELETMIRKAYDFDCPLVEAAPGDYTLELFHGPTFAFKDFGGRFMGGMLGLLGKGSKEAITVLTATSGDTGSAVAAGFYEVPGVDVVVLYPEGKVSNLQESQMTTLGKNIHPVRVRGNFDDCQALVKAVFNDKEFRQSKNVTSANSINLLRWIPQSFYYFYGWCQWADATGGHTPDIVVPSGNYGNITAGMLASFMGLPVRRFIAASNANDVVPKFLTTGVYEPRASVRTIANAMDVGAPSNYERMMYLYKDHQTLTKTMEGYAYSDDEIRHEIAALFQESGYITDPHSATGRMAAKAAAADGFRLSTAHCAKFREVIAEVLGQEPEIPAPLREAMEREKVFYTMDNSLEALESYLASIA